MEEIAVSGYISAQIYYALMYKYYRNFIMTSTNEKKSYYV